MNNTKSTLKLLICQCMAILSASFIFCSCSVSSNLEVRLDERTTQKAETLTDIAYTIAEDEALSETKDVYLTLETHTIDYDIDDPINS